MDHTMLSAHTSEKTHEYYEVEEKRAVLYALHSTLKNTHSAKPTAEHGKRCLRDCKQRLLSIMN